MVSASNRSSHVFPPGTSRWRARLAWFCAASLAIHLLLVAVGPNWHEAWREPDLKPMNATLAAAGAAEPPPQPAPAAQPAPAVKPPVRPRIRPAVVAPARPEAAIPSPFGGEQEFESAPDEPQAAEQPVRQSEAIDSSEPAPAASAEAAPAETPIVKPVRRLARELPPRGAIAFDLFHGPDRMRVGRTRQHWELRDARYRLVSESETTGLAGLFRPVRLSYTSEGRFTPEGFLPERFSVVRQRGVEQRYGARFDWSAATVNFTSGGPPVPAPGGAQDLLSFVFQLSLLDLPQGSVRMAITNGAKIDQYDLDIGPEESLDTPLGALRVLPVRQRRAKGQESTEVWLAPAYRYLPVKVRFLNRQGEAAGEQVVSEIHVGAE